MARKKDNADPRPTGWRAWLAAARRAIRDPVNQLDERARQIRMVIEAMRRAVRSLLRDDVPRMAAALTYRTIFSLIPILVLGFLVMNAFSDTDVMVQQQIARLLDYLNLQAIEVESESAEIIEIPLPSDEGFDGGQDITREGYTFRLNLGKDGLRDTPDDEVTGTYGENVVILTSGPDGVFGTEDDRKTEHVIASQSARTVSEWITTLVDRVRDVSLNAIGIVGILMLVYGSLSLMVEVEQCFNLIYSAPRGRSWFRRIPQYWLVLTLGPALLVAGFYVGEQFREWFAAIAGAKQGQGDDGAGAGGWTVKVIGHIVTVVISWVMLLLLYGLVPNTRVHLRPALIGSFVAAVSWEIGKALFREYVQGPALVSLYGSLALIPLFLLWVYVTWGVVLFGLKVSYLLQHATWRPDEMETRARQTIVGPSVLVAAAAHVARAFEDGRVLDEGELAAELSLEGPVLDQVLCALAERHVLRRAEPDEEEGVAPGEQAEGWTLARPADRIAVADLVRIGQSVARLERVVAARVPADHDPTAAGLAAAGPQAPSRGGAPDDGHINLLARIEEAQVRAVERITLADLVRRTDALEGDNR